MCCEAAPHGGATVFCWGGSVSNHKREVRIVGGRHDGYSVVVDTRDDFISLPFQDEFVAARYPVGVGDKGGTFEICNYRRYWLYNFDNRDQCAVVYAESDMSFGQVIDALVSGYKRP